MGSGLNPGRTLLMYNKGSRNTPFIYIKNNYKCEQYYYICTHYLNKN